MKTLLLLVLSACLTAAAQAAGQATKPAPVAGRVLVVPFQPVGEAKPAWVGSAVQQNLLAELARIPGVEPVSVADLPAGPLQPHEAVALAEKAGATHVVFGTFQSVENELRLTGQIVEVAGSVVRGGIKATGPVRDLFALEDELARQARQVMPRRVPAEAVAANDERMLLPQPKVPVAPLNEPVRVNLNPFDGSDLQRAVRRGRIDVPPLPVDDDYYVRRDWYRYGTPVYGYPVHGWHGYYPPYYSWRIRRTWLNVAVPPTMHFTSFGNAATFPPMHARPQPMTVQFLPPMQARPNP